MFNLLLGGFIGLMLGWNLLPQPLWAKALWEKVTSWFSGPKE